MATVSIMREWPDGETLTVSVDVDDSFPDVVAEAKQNAVNAYADALEVTLTADKADTDATEGDGE